GVLEGTHLTSPQRGEVRRPHLFRSLVCPNPGATIPFNAAALSGKREKRMRPEDVRADKNRPFTGSEYLESLRQGREVYINGERVKDVTTHPAFRNSARSIARLYDALHDPATKEVLTAPTDTGSPGYTHRFFKAARSRDDLRAQKEAITVWARKTYGW